MNLDSAQLAAVWHIARPYQDFVASRSCGAYDGSEGEFESQEEYYSAGPILAFPLVRSSDDMSTLLELRTTIGSNANAVLLVCTYGRSIIHLDYSQSETNASVLVGEAI